MPVAIDKEPVARSAPFVDATLNYRLDPSKGGDDTIWGGTVGEKRRKYQPCDVKVFDMRGSENEFHLDKHGFGIVKHTSVEKTFDDEPRVNDVYHKETAKLVQNVTGASHVHVISHLTRRLAWEELVSEDKNKNDMARVRGFSSARFVHCDQSYEGARKRLGIDFPEDAERLSKSRWAIINVWRPIETIRREPLCVADARSLAQDELHQTKHIIPIVQPDGSMLENLMWTMDAPAGPTQHKWYYLSNMTPEEVLLLKIFDSKKDGTSNFLPHTAFTTPDDSGPARQSLEVRCFVFWEDQSAE